MLTILLDGVAYGMLLFVLASGLSVTLGLMNFINLAHGAFAMVGGYVTALLMNRAGVPFLVTLPAAFVIPAALGVALERTLYRRLYGASPLDQVLFSIGLVLMAMPIAAYFIGDEPQQVHLPAWLDGRIEVHGVGIGVYRLFIIAVCGAIAAALQIFLIKTRFGAQLRAAVDDARVAQGLGINVDRIFAIAFAVGSGLAGLGGALAADVVGGIDPSFPVKFLVTFLIVVTVGGSNGILGALFGALLLGVLDVAGKYYAPSIGAFIIYAVMVVTLIVAPARPVRARRRAMSAPEAAAVTARLAAHLQRRARWRWPEIVFWLAILALIFALPSRAGIINEVLIAGLFALSLDLILGLTGIVSLGHAAFLGLGAYGAAILASKGFAEPALGLAFGAAVAAVVGLVSAPLLLRGGDLTRLMVTLGVSLMLGELANRNSWLTGGADGLNFSMAPVLGLFPIDFTGQRNAALYSFAVLFILFAIARRLAHSPFGLALAAIRENRLRAGALGVDTSRRIVAIYTIAAAYAGAAGALLAQTTQIVSLDLFDFHRSADVMLMLIIGGAGYLYGGLIGAAAFIVLRDVISAATPEYWEFWIGLALVILVLAGRDRIGAAAKRIIALVAPRAAGRGVA